MGSLVKRGVGVFVVATAVFVVGVAYEVYRFSEVDETRRADAAIVGSVQGLF